MLKHIVFDCDGVLWDGTNEGYVRCYHQAAVDAGIDIELDLARQRILAKWGTSALHEIEGLIPEHPHLVADVVQRYRRLVRSDLFLGTAALIPGVRETLERLAERYGLSAITGMNLDNLGRLMERFQLRPFFRHTISTGEVNDPSQQKRTGYHLRQVLDQEGLAPQEALCVGDALVDVEMARCQHVPIVVVLTGHLDERQARKLGVQAVLPAVTDLPAWIAESPAA